VFILGLAPDVNLNSLDQRTILLASAWYAETDSVGNTCTKSHTTKQRVAVAHKRDGYDYVI
jgi:hypothetical protein